MRDAFKTKQSTAANACAMNVRCNYYNRLKTSRARQKGHQGHIGDCVFAMAGAMCNFIDGFDNIMYGLFGTEDYILFNIVSDSIT